MSVNELHSTEAREPLRTRRTSPPHHSRAGLAVMRERFEVTIAGGGVAGLAAALAFRKAGYAVTVVERAAAFGPVGAGILLQANGLMVLDALELGEEVRSRNCDAALPAA